MSMPPPVADRRAVLLGLAAAGLAPAIARAKAPAWTGTAALVSRYVDEGKLSGACVLVRKGEHLTTISRGAGGPGGRVVDERTIWRIFSMSKPVTGVAAMALIEDGKLGLDQPVADFVPAFKTVQVLEGEALRPARTEMKVRHLLTHTSGVGYFINEDAVGARHREAVLRPADPVAREGAPRSLEEFGARLATVPLGSDPGTAYQYSASLDLLGLVIQNASGMPFSRYLRERLFDRMAMTDTGFAVSESQRARLATNFAVRDGKLVALETEGPSPYFSLPPYVSGGGGLVSSARDYDRFCAMLLDDGAFDGRQVIARGTARRARSNLLPRGVVAEGGLEFGAGMGLVSSGYAEADGMPAGSVFWGGAAGTFMWIDPVNKLSVVLMTQFVPSRAYRLWSELRTAIYADLAA